MRKEPVGLFNKLLVEMASARKALYNDNLQAGAFSGLH